MFDPPILTTGTVIDSPSDKVYHVSLPNSKVIIGHIPLALIDLHAQIKTDTVVNLEITPFDLSKGRIMSIASNSEEPN